MDGAQSAEEAAGAGATEVVYVRSDRARQYRLTLRRDGVAVATIPRRGSEREARLFVSRHLRWLERARARLRAQPLSVAEWRPGTVVHWRGAEVPIEVRPGAARPEVALGADVFRVPRLEGDLRPALQIRMAHRARIELPARAWELAAGTDTPITNVVVRNQRARWGSCSARGVISLNWRLIQAPDAVRDYLIYHELMHRREMNHSGRFWRHVEEVCPGWRAAERWLRGHAGLLGG